MNPEPGIQSSPLLAKGQEEVSGLTRLALFVGLLIATFSLLGRNLQFSQQWAFGDHAPIPYSSQQVWNNLAYSWDWTSLGAPGTSGDLFIVASSRIATLLPGVSVDGILLFGLLPLSSVTAYFLLARTFKNSLFIIPGAVFYGLDPLTVSAFIGGEGGLDTGLLAGYALFPVFIYAVTQSNGRVRRVESWALVACVGLLVGLVGANLPELAWTFAPLTVLLFISAIATGSQNWRTLLGRLIAVVLIAAPLLFLSLSDISGAAATPSIYSQYSASSLSFIYQPATIINLIRGAGSQGSAQWYLGYNGFAWWDAIGLVLSGIACLGLLNIKSLSPNERALTLFGGLSLVSSLALASAVRAGLLTQLIATNSALSPLSDIANLQFWTVAGLSMMLPAGGLLLVQAIQTIAEHANIPRRTQPWGHESPVRNRPHSFRPQLLAAVLSSTLVIIVVAANAPATDGTVGLANVRGQGYVLPTPYIQLESAVANGTIDFSHYRGLWLPFDGTDLPRLHWLTTGLVNAPYEWEFLSNDSSSVLQLYNVLCNPAIGNLSLLLQSWAIKYVFLDYYDAAQIPNSVVEQSECSVASSPVFSTIEMGVDYLNTLRGRLGNDAVVYSRSGIVVLDTHANPVLYLGGGNLTNEPQSQPFVLSHYGPNIVNGSSPYNSSAWGVWPNQGLLEETAVDRFSFLDLVVSPDGLSVASQLLRINSSSVYNISYSIVRASADARIRILWYNETSNLSDGAASAATYVPNSPLPGPVGIEPENFSSTVVPPVASILGKFELLAAWFTSGPDQNASALFGNVSVTAVTQSINTEELISSSECSPVAEVVNPTTFQLSAGNCSGQFVLVLDTAFDQGWTAIATSGSSTGGGEVLSHGVANFLENGWIVNLSRGTEVVVSFSGSESRTLEVYAVAVYISVGFVLVAWFWLWKKLDLTNRSWWKRSRLCSRCMNPRIQGRQREVP